MAALKDEFSPLRVASRFPNCQTPLSFLDFCLVRRKFHIFIPTTNAQAAFVQEIYLAHLAPFCLMMAFQTGYFSALHESGTFSIESNHCSITEV